MWGAVIGSVAGSLIGADASSNAASKAARAQDRASQIQWDMYQQQREDYEPYRQIGTSALERLGQQYGLYNPELNDIEKQIAQYEQYLQDAYKTPYTGGGQLDVKERKSLGDIEGGVLGTPFGEGGPWYRGGDSRYYVEGVGVDTARIKELEEKLADLRSQREALASAAPQQGTGDFSDFYASPDYQFRLQEGQKQLERAAAARGSRLAGGTLAALQQRGQDIASQEYGNYYNRMAALAGIGQTATGQLGQLGAMTAQSMGQYAAGAGQYQAAGAMGQANAIGGGLASLASLYGSGQLGSSSMGESISNQTGYTGGWGGVLSGNEFDSW